MLTFPPSVMLKTSDFATPIVATQGTLSKTINGIFDRHYQPSEFGGLISSAEETEITAYCYTPDILDVRHGASFSINQVGYTVIGVRPDEDGEYTEIVLREGLGALGVPPESTVPPLKIPFSFGDASPRQIFTVSAGQTITTAQIVITAAFNSGSLLSIGDAGDIGRLFPANRIDPSEVAEWEYNPNYTYQSQTPITVSISTNGATGAGYILLEVS